MRPAGTGAVCGDAPAGPAKPSAPAGLLPDLQACGARPPLRATTERWTAVCLPVGKHSAEFSSRASQKSGHTFAKRVVHVFHHKWFVFGRKQILYGNANQKKKKKKKCSRKRKITSKDDIFFYLFPLL